MLQTYPECYIPVMLIVNWRVIYVSRLECRQVNNNLQCFISGFVPMVEENLYIDLYPGLLA